MRIGYSYTYIDDSPGVWYVTSSASRVEIVEKHKQKRGLTSLLMKEIAVLRFLSVLGAQTSVAASWLMSSGEDLSRLPSDTSTVHEGKYPLAQN